MSLYIEKKYLLLLGSRLQNFKQRKESLWNCRCTYCGDSKKNKSKARMYFYVKNENMFVICYNCGVSTTFGKFLEYMDSSQYKSYIFERYTNGQSKYAPVEKPEGNMFVTKQKPSLKKTISDFKEECVLSLPDGHFAKEYIKNRKIPQRFWNEILYTGGYKSWINKNFPDYENDRLLNDPRIVLLYTNQGGEITHVSGRALANADKLLRYITIKVSEEERKVFGLHRLNFKEKVYITEGQFDSLFIENAVASGDSNLMGLADYLFDEYGLNSVLVFDNEPRNVEIVQTMKKNVENNNWDMVIFPQSFKFKDLNEAVMNGVAIEKIKSVLEENEYAGLSAQLKLSEWRKI